MNRSVGTQRETQRETKREQRHDAQTVFAPLIVGGITTLRAGYTAELPIRWNICSDRFVESPKEVPQLQVITLFE